MPDERPFDSPYRNQLVRVAELTVTTDTIEGSPAKPLRFENCQIVGPAVLGLLANVSIAECTFDVGVAGLDAMIWIVQPGWRIGAVGLRHLEFFKCTFVRCGFAVTSEDAEKLFYGPLRGQENQGI